MNEVSFQYRSDKSIVKTTAAVAILDQFNRCMMMIISAESLI